MSLYGNKTPIYGCMLVLTIPICVRKIVRLVLCQVPLPRLNSLTLMNLKLFNSFRLGALPAIEFHMPLCYNTVITSYSIHYTKLYECFEISLFEPDEIGEYN